jgi:hypothetical protein
MAKPPPHYLNDLPGFVGDLRSLLFSSQRKAAAYFRVSRPTITRYENGTHLPPPGYVACLARLLAKRQEETIALTYQETLLKEVNRAIHNNYEDTLFRDWDELCEVAEEYLAQRQNSDVPDERNVVSTAARTVFPIYLDSTFFRDALKDWMQHFFRWSEASEHLRSSWTGMVIHAMTVLASRITPRGFLTTCVSLLLGIATAKLIMPVLQWPLNEVYDRWMACFSYSLATLLIPFFVAFVTPPDRPSLFQLETARQRMIFWVLKLTGALVGFWVFSVLIIGLALTAYYLYLPPLAAGIRLILALIPLFFSYVTARRIPLDRLTMFNGDLRPHPADHLFLVIFTIAGPLMAFFLYFFYKFFSNRSIAPVTLVVLFTLIDLWEYRKQHPTPI